MSGSIGAELYIAEHNGTVRVILKKDNGDAFLDKDVTIGKGTL